MSTRRGDRLCININSSGGAEEGGDFRGTPACWEAFPEVAAALRRSSPRLQAWPPAGDPMGPARLATATAARNAPAAGGPWGQSAPGRPASAPCPGARVGRGAQWCPRGDPCRSRLVVLPTDHSLTPQQWGYGEHRDVNCVLLSNKSPVSCGCFPAPFPLLHNGVT